MVTRSLIGSIDDVDGLTCSSCYSGWANLTIDDAIAQGSDINEFAQSFAVKPDDIDAQWLKDLTAAMTTDAVRDAIIKEYDGGYINAVNTLSGFPLVYLISARQINFIQGNTHGVSYTFPISRVCL